MTRRRPGLWALALVWAISARAAVADRTAADFFVQRAEKAQRERNWVEAQQLFRKALEEDAAHVPARLGLAEVLYAAGDRAGALETWRLVASAGAGGTALPPVWAELARRATLRVADLEAAGSAFSALLDRQVDALLAFSKRCKEKDPDVAALALERALRLRPGHAAATGALQALGGGGADPTEWTALFDGKEMTGFLEPDPAAWQVSSGVMVGDVPGGTYLMWSRDQLHGDFDLRMEARVTKSHSPRPILLLCGAQKGKHEGTQVGLFFADLVIRECDGPAPGEQHHPYVEALAKLAAVDVSAWTTYELQFRGPKIRFVVNGSLLAERDRAPGRAGGQAALLVQDVRVEVRKFGVLQR